VTRAEPRVTRFRQGEHEGTVFYTTDDDGVWVGCEVCVWETNLGFSPEPSTVIMAFNAHIDEDRRTRGFPPVIDTCSDCGMQWPEALGLCVDCAVRRREESLQGGWH
jgi:hypothetical protein